MIKSYNPKRLKIWTTSNWRSPSRCSVAIQDFIKENLGSIKVIYDIKIEQGEQYRKSEYNWEGLIIYQERSPTLLWINQKLHGGINE